MVFCKQDLEHEAKLIMDRLSMIMNWYDEDPNIDVKDVVVFLDSYVRSYRKLKADVERNK